MQVLTSGWCGQLPGDGPGCYFTPKGGTGTGTNMDANFSITFGTAPS